MSLSTDPSPETDPGTVDLVLDGLAAVAGDLADTAPADRAVALRAVAAALDAQADELAELAHGETGLPMPRLVGEVARTTGQLRLFADELEDGSWLDAVIDTPDPDAAPVPRPDLRRMQVSLGPVVVFAASNFPFAFSVAGGDTASALAAGCPVVVKAHPGHPLTSRRTAEVVTRAWEGAGMPNGSFALVEGVDTGIQVLRHPVVAAGAFTGSEGGGTALARVAAEREVPVPFYAEMGSLNPVFVTPGAVAARGGAIADGYVASFTLGVGQFCTKPGLLFLPRGHGLDARLAAAVEGVAPGRSWCPGSPRPVRPVRPPSPPYPACARSRRPAPPAPARWAAPSWWPPTRAGCSSTATSCWPSASARPRSSWSTSARTRRSRRPARWEAH